ncbi:unnamed protein product [Lepeophtheirus salmonis]|uniref:(salmon louse) hypothetical protein n=1 Tax=Lepeophtheirus salmonis TaxID=72036 RepID=A0A7R8H509_LEPSM|nr:unnamed protein product [Lepeophtheirus salmonis]CAF2872498.1 unnamed protein product [Lepeophtheirus salmonis]
MQKEPHICQILKEDYDIPGGWDPDVPRLRKCLKNEWYHQFFFPKEDQQSHHFVKRGIKIVKAQKMMLKSHTFEDNIIEVEIKVRDSKEEHMKKDAIGQKCTVQTQTRKDHASSSLFLSIKTLANVSELF